MNTSSICTDNSPLHQNQASQIPRVSFLALPFSPLLLRPALVFLHSSSLLLTLLFPFSPFLLPLPLSLQLSSFLSTLLCPTLPFLTCSFWILPSHFPGFGVVNSKCHFTWEWINQKMGKRRGKTLSLDFSCLLSVLRFFHWEFYRHNQSLSSVLLYCLGKEAREAGEGRPAAGCSSCSGLWLWSIELQWNTHWPSFAGTWSFWRDSMHFYFS